MAKKTVLAPARSGDRGTGVDRSKTVIPREVRVDLSVLGIVANDRAVVRAATPTLLLTVEASVARMFGAGPDLTLDRASCIVLPAGTDVALGATASTSRVAVLSFREPLFALVEQTYSKLGFDRVRLDRWLRRMSVLPRTVWIHEIVHRYVFERYALDEHDNMATRFLETEILKELFFLFRDRETGADRATLLRKTTRCVERAVSHIEAHLFDRCNVAALASHAGASESTLLRSFQSELGCGPGAYWRNRKLDEALVQLRSGRDSVREVAGRIGYDNPAAFAHAFRHRFGRAPSSFRPTRPLRSAPR